MNTRPDPVWPWALVGSALLPMLLYLLTASPGPYWLDSGEFVAAAWTQGVPHPPGHPLYTAWASGSGLLPLGSLSLRAHLVSGLFAALSCATLAWTLRRWLLRWQVPAPRASVAALATAVLAGTSYAFWFQAVRAEVYTLHLWTASLSVALGLEMELRASSQRRADPRLLYGLAWVLGLGLANHHYLTVFTAPPLMGLLLLRGAWRRVLLSWHGLRACLLGLLGLSTYLLLPLRALQDPWVNWGDPRTAQRFWWVLTARDFQKALGRAEEVQVGRLLDDLFFVLVQQLTPLGLLLAAVGLVWMLRAPARRGAGLLVGGFMLCNLVTQSLFNFDRFNPDVYGYFALTVWCMALLAGASLGGLEQLSQHLQASDEQARARARTLVARAGVGFVALVAALNLAWTLPRARLDGFRDVDITTAALLDEVPQGALLLTSHYNTLFNLWYAQAVEQQRPDVTSLHRNFFANEPYVAEVQRRHPALAPLMAAPARKNTVDTALLLEQARRRPVFLEYDVNIQPDLHPHLVPAGFLFQVVPREVAAAPLTQEQAQRHMRAQDRLAQHLALRNQERGELELETQRHLLWQHYLMARGLIATRRYGLARFHLDRASAINPSAPELAELRAALPSP
jgi:hypothetical protein